MIRELPTALRQNPFPGLRPFEPHEDYLFFGREQQVDELLRRLRTLRFVAVLGTSGSGKSSLVRAGLIPSLHGGAMTSAGSSWRVAIMRPGDDPIGNLAAALDAPEALGPERDEDGLYRALFETTLRASRLGLVECVQHARLEKRDNVLVLVDQFEELFRFKQSKDAGHSEALAFVKLLIVASRYPRMPIYVVLTMRSDFIGNCIELAELPEIVNNDGLYLVPRLTRDELRAAITGPVAVGGASSISPRLAARLLNDVGDHNDQLPILQHALMRTWDCWEGHHTRGEPLDLRQYEKIGTMESALSQHAEEALGELDERGRGIAETLFKALTEKGADGRGIRRPATVGEICMAAGATEAEVTAVVDRFRLPGRSFLMPPTEIALRASSVLDLSHESLMRIWDRLAAWVDEEAQSAQTYLGLARAAALHETGKAALWRDPELQVALTWRQSAHPTGAWAQRYDPSFERAMRFLDASEQERHRESAERDEHRRGKQRQRLLRWMVGLLAAVVLVILGFGAYAYSQKNAADRARRQAEAERAKAERAKTEALTSGARATAEAGRAARQQELADQARVKAIQEQREAESQRQKAERLQRIAEGQRTLADQQRLRAEAEELKAKESAKAALEARIEAENRTREAAQEKSRADLLSASADQSAAVARRLNRLALARTVALQTLRLPDDQSELSALLALRAHRLHVENGGASEEPALFNALRAALDRLRPQPVWTGSLDAVRAIALDPRGTALFSAGDDGKVRRLDLAHPGTPGPVLAASRKGFSALAVDSAGRRLATGSADGSIRVLDLQGKDPVRVLASRGAPVAALAYQPDGNLLAAGHSDGGVTLWTTAGTAADPVRPPSGGSGVTAVTFSPDGAILAAGLGKGGALLWDAKHPESPPKPACAGRDVRSIAFLNDGLSLACGTARGEIFLDYTRERLQRTLRGHGSSVSSLAFRKEGNVLVSGSADRTVRLWDLSRSDLEPLVLAGHSSRVSSVAFLPGGDAVASGGADHTVRLWDARSEKLVSELCRRVTRPLSPKEWEQFFPDLDGGGDDGGGRACP